MKTEYSDVVAEYLHELDLRLAGLPVLQRRELLADLAAHIENERVERNLRGEAELIEVLERLGSPEVVARAAYEEAGPLPPPPVAGPPMPPPAQREGSPWVWPAIGAVIVGLLVLMVLCAGFFFLSRSSGPEPSADFATPESQFGEPTAPAPPTPTDAANWAPRPEPTRSR